MVVPQLEIGEPAMDLGSPAKLNDIIIDVSSPLTSFHYQVKNVSSLSMPWPSHTESVTAVAAALLRTTDAQRVQNVYIFLYLGKHCQGCSQKSKIPHAHSRKIRWRI